MWGKNQNAIINKQIRKNNEPGVLKLDPFTPFYA